MELFRERRYANLGVDLIEVNVSPILFSPNPLDLFLKGFWELEILVNNLSIKKEKIGIGRYTIVGVAKDYSNGNMTVIVTVNVEVFKWHSFKFKLEVNGKPYDLIEHPN